jgi:hypothetical protein
VRQGSSRILVSDSPSRCAGSLLKLFCICLLAPLSSRAADALDSWTSTIIITNHYTLRSLAYGNGVYVLGGDGTCSSDAGTVFTSTDGLNWTLRRDGCVDGFGESLGIAYGSGLFVSVGYPGLIYSATNGINWTLCAQAPFYNFTGVAHNGTNFVAVGDGGLIAGGNTLSNIYTSPDGITWRMRLSGAVSDPYCPIYCVACGGGAFVALGEGGTVPPTVFRSTTGSTWARSSPGAFCYVDNLDFCNGRFIAAAGAGTNLVSPDGITWSVQTNDSHLNFQKVLFAHGIYMALGNNGGEPATYAFLTSTNGTNWTQRDFSIPSQATVQGFGIADRRVIAFGNRFLGPAGYAGYTYSSDSLLGFSANTGSTPSLNVSGLVGAPYRIDFATNLVISGSNFWQTLSNFSLLASPYTISDPQAVMNSKRFYRAVLRP